MKIKFNLLKEKLTNQGLELQVSECLHENKIVDKIVLKSIYKPLSKDENDKLFIVKNIQSSEIKFEPNTSELIIDSPSFVIFPAKIDFLFAAKKITKIRLSNSNEQFKKIIEEDKDEYFFIINRIKNHSFLSASSGTKMLILSANSFQTLERSTLFHPEPLKIFVRSPKNNNNYYLIKCQSDLTAIGLKNYKKIRIISPEKINDGDMIKFDLTNLKDILQRDEEDEILRIDNDYRSFTKIQDGSVVSPQQQAQRDIQKQIKKFLKKYQNEQAGKINDCQKNLE
ncbi:9449_t:CDS:2, partial [Entrophospora sp. SA101]